MFNGVEQVIFRRTWKSTSLPRLQTRGSDQHKDHEQSCCLHHESTLLMATEMLCKRTFDNVMNTYTHGIQHGMENSKRWSKVVPIVQTMP